MFYPSVSAIFSDQCCLRSGGPIDPAATALNDLKTSLGLLNFLRGCNSLRELFYKGSQHCN